MSAHIHGVREQLVVTLYGSTLPDLLRFAANWIETRRENGVLSADPSFVYREDDQGHWLDLIVETMGATL